MSCLTTASLLACLLSPSNLSIEATASSKIAGDFKYYDDGQYLANPIYGRFRLVLRPQISPNLYLIYGVEHESVINASDRGTERFFGGFVWTPFKRN